MYLNHLFLCFFCYLQAIETRNFGISKSVLWPGGVIPYELSADTFGISLFSYIFIGDNSYWFGMTLSYGLSSIYLWHMNYDSMLLKKCINVFTYTIVLHFWIDMSRRLVNVFPRISCTSIHLYHGFCTARSMHFTQKFRMFSLITIYNNVFTNLYHSSAFLNWHVT